LEVAERHIVKAKSDNFGTTVPSRESKRQAAFLAQPIFYLLNQMGAPTRQGPLPSR